MRSVRASTSIADLRVPLFGAIASLCVLLAGPAPAAPSTDELYDRSEEVETFGPGETAADSLAQSPPEATPVETQRWRSEIDRAWFEGEDDLDARAQNVARRAMELGVGDVEHAARALISLEAPGTPMRNTRLATRLAPRLPIAHVAEARALWDEGRKGEAMESWVRAVTVLPRHLEASLWLAASVLVMFAAVALLGSLCFIAAVAATVFAHAAHDVGDPLSKHMPSFARAALLATGLLLPILFGQGLLGFVLVLFALGFVYGNRAHRVSLALAAVLIVLALFPVSRIAGVALGALAADPVAAASHAVVQGTETRADVELLEQAAASDDALAEHVLAMRARRSGNLEEARLRYAALLEHSEDDPIISTNLANLKFREGDSAGAIALYEDAAARMNSPIVLFNLSQAYASAFRMEEFERTMQLAQAISPDTAQALSRAGDADFVADLPLPTALIRERMVLAAQGEELQQSVVSMFAPGVLGSSWIIMAASFALVALIAGLFGRRFDHSSRCTRCGRRICGRCDGTYWNSEICDPCHHLFHMPETTDPTLRTGRLAVLRRRDARIERISLAASMLVPGAAGFLAKRPDHAFVGILLFLSAAVMLVWRTGVVPDPLAVGDLGPAMFTLAALCAGFAYAVLVLSGLVIRSNG